MRETIGLQSDWWVSPSAGDARLAAAGDGFSVADLELASEPDNHPRRLSLREAVGTCGWRDLPRQGETKPETPSGYAHGSPPSTPPKPRRVPTQWLTYARRLAIPAGWAGQRVFLNLDNVRYHVTAWINDRQVAHYRGGLEPHRLDITDAVTPGGTALLTLTVGDSGVSALRPFDTSNYTGTRLPTCKEIENNLVHPVVYGGADRAVGQVSVETAPAVRTEYVFADPRVSAGELRFHVCLANDSDRPRRVRVCSEALDGRPLLHRRVQLPPRSTQTVQRNVAWPDAIRWDLDNPHLYTVVTVIEEDGAVLDTHTDSFGFREFTVNGHSFYLNGRKIHLHGQSGHTSPDTDWMSLDEKIAYLRAWKERGHITHFRLHARPQHREWVVAADRVGLLVTTETALWTTGYHSFDWVGSEEACAGNVCNHFLEALVRRDRNNPSVVIWSLSNEMSPITPFDLENPKMAALTRVLLRAIAAARAEDGSRFIQMSSAMDFLGHLELYNLHYPKNWQAFPDYPHTA